MVRLLAQFFAVAPFGAAIFRAAQAGHDLRLLWMAMAGLVGAMACAVVMGRSRTRPISWLAIGAATLLVSTLLAVVTARLLGASAAPGIWAVAIVFGICHAISSTLRLATGKRDV